VGLAREHVVQRERFVHLRQGTKTVFDLGRCDLTARRKERRALR